MDPSQSLSRPPSGIGLGGISSSSASFSMGSGSAPSVGQQHPPGGGGSYTDSSEFVGPVPVMDEVAKLRMVIGDDEVRIGVGGMDGG